MSATFEIETITAPLTSWEARSLARIQITSVILDREVALPEDLGFDRLVDCGSQRITGLQFGKGLPEDGVKAAYFLDRMLEQFSTGEVPDIERDYGSTEAYQQAAQRVANIAFSTPEMLHPDMREFSGAFLQTFNETILPDDPNQPELPIWPELDIPLFRVA